MKKLAIVKGFTPLAIALSSLTFVSSAVAEPTPAPTSDSIKNPQEQYKIDKDNYIATIKLRNQRIKSINLVFKNACEKASQDFKIAMSNARTPDQKNLANATRKSAISAAIIARDAAITALGEVPVAPIEPPKPMRANTKNKSR